MIRSHKWLIFILGILIVVFSIGIIAQHTTKPNITKPPSRTEPISATTPEPPSNSTTFRNNYGTNIMNGRTGSFQKSSFTWTVTNNDGNFNIKSNAVSGSFNVVYSHYDAPNKLHYYNATGNAYFDNAVVKVVMTNGKLEDYAVGNLTGGNILSIVFTDNNGYIYKLGK